jgi:hypothetical protein
VGPLAVVQPNAMGAAFRTALDLATGSGAAQVSAFLPGVSEGLSAAASASTLAQSVEPIVHAPISRQMHGRHGISPLIELG